MAHGTEDTVHGNTTIPFFFALLSPVFFFSTLGILAHFRHYLSDAHSHNAAATPHTALKKSTKTGVMVPKSKPIIPLFS